MYLGPEPWFGWITRWSPQTVTLLVVVALLGALLVRRASGSLRWAWVPAVLAGGLGLLLFGVPVAQSYRVDRATDALTSVAASAGLPVAQWTARDLDCPWDSNVGVTVAGQWPVSDSARIEPVLARLAELDVVVHGDQVKPWGTLLHDGVRVTVRSDDGPLVMTGDFGC